MSDANRINGAASSATEKRPTHGAIELPMLSALLKHFKETPMAHDISDPFVKSLSSVMLITLEAAKPQELAK
jgi:hypothetical protein